MKSQTDDQVIQASYMPWHRPLLESLVSLKNQHRLPHAVLVETSSAEDGISFLWHLCMLLLCNKCDDIEPCGQCSSCSLMQSNTYPDFNLVTIIYDEKRNKLNKNIKIEQIRKLIHEVFLTNSYDNLKIAAIYPADKMSIEGANSLLKTLEEPTQQTLLLLLTDNKGKIPITIRSRCQIWPLKLPTREIALDWLIGQGMDDTQAQQYLDYGNGDPQLAVQLKSIDYATIVDQFKRLFAQYLSNDIDVTRLCSSITRLPAPMIRRLIKMVISAYCYQYCGLTKRAQQQSITNKQLARQVILLLDEAQQKLMVEENNLDLQLQLEDVLISLKQIIKQGIR